MRYRFFILIFFVTCLFGCESESALIQSKQLKDFPSGSAVEYFNNRVYVAGDDARFVLIMDKLLQETDTVQLYPPGEKRMPSGTKPDLEGMAAVKDSNTPCLLLLGSGSLEPYRNTGWLINPSKKHRIQIRTDTFYRRLAIRGVEEINIEGIVSAGNQMILANRGNKNNRVNHLIITSPRFLQEQATAPIRLIRVGGQTDSSSFAGISGLDYSAKSDRLILTISTENTSNSIEDGEIGKSYLWVINDLVSKIRLTAINPNKVIDLEGLDNAFANQKIESACILSESRNWMELLLVADNDNGETQLFRIKIPK